MHMHEQCLLWPIDIHCLILKSQSKMADLWEITRFPILNIWRPFHSQISGDNDLSWTYLSMNNVCYGPLMYIASFWNLCPCMNIHIILSNILTDLCFDDSSLLHIMGNHRFATSPWTCSFYFYLQLLKDQPCGVNYKHPMQCLSRHSVYFRSKATKLSRITMKQLPL